MKLSNLLTFLFFLFSFVFFAQSQEDTLQSARSLKTDKRDLVIIRNQPNKTIKADTIQQSSTSTKTTPKQTEWTVESLDRYIASVENKIAIVKTNPAYDAKALASGWYDKMYSNINEAKQKKEELLKLKQNK